MQRLGWILCRFIRRLAGNAPAGFRAVRSAWMSGIGGKRGTVGHWYSGDWYSQRWRLEEGTQNQPTEPWKLRGIEGEPSQARLRQAHHRAQLIRRLSDRHLPHTHTHTHLLILISNQCGSFYAKRP